MASSRVNIDYELIFTDADLHERDRTGYILKKSYGYGVNVEYRIVLSGIPFIHKTRMIINIGEDHSILTMLVKDNNLMLQDFANHLKKKVKSNHFESNLISAIGEYINGSKHK